MDEKIKNLNGCAAAAVWHTRPRLICQMYYFWFFFFLQKRPLEYTDKCWVCLGLYNFSTIICVLTINSNMLPDLLQVCVEVASSVERLLLKKWNQSLGGHSDRFGHWLPRQRRQPWIIQVCPTDQMTKIISRGPKSPALILSLPLPLKLQVFTHRFCGSADSFLYIHANALSSLASP